MRLPSRRLGIVTYLMKSGHELTSSMEKPMAGLAGWPYQTGPTRHGIVQTAWLHRLCFFTPQMPTTFQPQRQASKRERLLRTPPPAGSLARRPAVLMPQTPGARTPRVCSSAEAWVLGNVRCSIIINPMSSWQSPARLLN